MRSPYREKQRRGIRLLCWVLSETPDLNIISTIVIRFLTLAYLFPVIFYVSLSLSRSSLQNPSILRKPSEYSRVNLKSLSIIVGLSLKKCQRLKLNSKKWALIHFDPLVCWCLVLFVCLFIFLIMFLSHTKLCIFAKWSLDIVCISTPFMVASLTHYTIWTSTWTETFVIGVHQKHELW